MTRLVLMPSPLLGPSVWAPVGEVLHGRGWAVCVARLPDTVRTPEDVAAAYVAAAPVERDLVLVPHSNAGLYVPAIAAQREVAAAVFVDAALPAAGTGMAPDELVRQLETMVDDAGLLPPWTSWWPEDELAALFPDETTRRLVEEEQPRLPLSYLRAEAPEPRTWGGRGGYLAFGETYATERQQAAARGWPVRTLAGEHLHMLVDPEGVAAALEGLLGAVGVGGVG